LVATAQKRKSVAGSSDHNPAATVQRRFRRMFSKVYRRQSRRTTRRSLRESFLRAILHHLFASGDDNTRAFRARGTMDLDTIGPLAL
jgi:hypothetical protein